MIKFDYVLSGLGWADVSLTINNQEYFASVSYLSDALGDLLKSIVSMIPDLANINENLKKYVSFKWYSEPGGTIWNLKLSSNSEIGIEVIKFKDIDRETEKRKVVCTKCNLISFISAIVKSIDKLLIEHGLIGYHNTWCYYDFPISNYLLLKSLLDKETTVSLAERDNDTFSSELTDEILLLNSIVAAPHNQESVKAKE